MTLDNQISLIYSFYQNVNACMITGQLLLMHICQTKITWLSLAEMFAFSRLLLHENSHIIFPKQENSLKRWLTDPNYILRHTS